MALQCSCLENPMDRRTYSPWGQKELDTTEVTKHACVHMHTHTHWWDSACQCRRLEFNPWVREMPWRRKWKSAPVFLPGISHGQRSLAGYSPRGHKESDTTEATEHMCTQEARNQPSILDSQISRRGLVSLLLLRGSLAGSAVPTSVV